MMPQQKSENHSTTFLIPRQWPVLVAPFPSVVYLHIPFHLESTIQIDPPCPSGTRRRRLWLWLGLFFTTSNLETSGRSSPLVSILLLPCLCVFLLRHLLRLYSIIIIYLFRYSRCLDAYTIGEMLPFSFVLISCCCCGCCGYCCSSSASRTHVTIPPAPVELNPVV